MSAVTPGTLAYQRQAVQRLMPELAQVQRLPPGTTKNRYGEVVRVWEPVGAPVPAQIAPLQGDEADVLAGRYADRALTQINLPWDTDVRRRDQIVIGSRTFDVLETNGPASYEVVRTAVVSEEQAPP